MLKTLRTKSRKLMWATLILVIPAFILFYGWSGNSGKTGQSQDIEIWKYQPAGTSKWQEITLSDLGYTEWELEQRMSDYVYQQKWSDYLRMNNQQKVIQEMIEGNDPRARIWREVQGMFNEGLVTQRDKALQYLDIEALESYASNKNVKVAEAELTEAMTNILKGYKPSQYYIPLSQAGLNQYNAETRVGDKIKLDRVRNMISRKAMVSRYELWKQYRLFNEEIKVSYVPFSLADFEDKVEVTDQALESYYSEHGENFRVGDQRRYRYAYQLRDSLADEVEVTDDEVQAYYDENHDLFTTKKAVKARHIFLSDREYTTSTLNQLNEIKAKLDEGADFAELANQYSQDPMNTQGQGDDAQKMGGALRDLLSDNEMMRNFYGQGFVQTALNMEEGKVSDIVVVNGWGGRGYSIIKVDDVLDPKLKPLAEVRDDIEVIVKQDKMQAAFSNRIEELRAKLRNTKYSSVDMAAKELDMQTGETDFMLKSDATIPVTSGTLRIQPVDLDYINENLSLDAQASFGSANQVPTMSGLLVTRSEMLGDTAAFIVQLVEEKDTHIPPLSEVREAVQEAYKREKGRELMREAAEAFRATAGKAESWEKAAETAEVELKSTDLFSRVSGRSVFQQGIPLDSVGISTDYKVGDTGVMALGYSPVAPSAYVAWRLDEVQSPDKADFEKEQTMLRARMMGMKRASFLEEWLLDQKRKMKIAIE